MNEKICPHCHELVKLRNPSGYCDHLYYPDNCTICTDRETELKDEEDEKEEESLDTVIIPTIDPFYIESDKERETNKT